MHAHLLTTVIAAIVSALAIGPAAADVVLDLPAPPPARTAPDEVESSPATTSTAVQAGARAGARAGAPAGPSAPAIDAGTIALVRYGRMRSAPRVTADPYAYRGYRVNRPYYGRYGNGYRYAYGNGFGYGYGCYPRAYAYPIIRGFHFGLRPFGAHVSH